MENDMEVTVSLTVDEADAFSDFLKRAYFDVYCSLAVSEWEAYQMSHAGAKIRRELARNGYGGR